MASKSLKKVGATIVALGMATSIYLAPDIINAKQNNLTGADMINNHFMASYLEELEEETNITFQNKELYDLLVNHFGGSLTVENLKSLTNLNFEAPLTNTDLSDFKYLTNLSQLTIRNNCVDCSDLMYNQQLKRVVFDNCTLTNTKDLPNTITTLELANTDVADDVLVVPFNTSLLNLQVSTLSKVQFKNTDNLKSFYFSGYGFIDMNDFKECSNLSKISLKQCPNVLNPELLQRFTNADISLDEFCTIWLNSKALDSISSISTSSKKEWQDISNYLDNKLSELISPDMTEEEKINNIIVYVLNQIEYDFRALEDNELGSELCSTYNLYPLSYAIEKNDGVCVGYASLFTALANRAGIDCYQPDRINHTWNMIRKINENEYSAYDLTQLDNEYAAIYENGSIVHDAEKTSIDYITYGEAEQLAYYDFDLSSRTSESYKTNIEPKSIEAKDINIGYIKTAISNNKNNTRLKLALFELLALIIFIEIKLLFSQNKKSNSNHTTKKKENHQVIKYKRAN